MGGYNKQKTKITLNISLVVCSDLASSTLIPKFSSLCLWTYSQFPFNRTACLLFSLYLLLNIYYSPSAGVGTLHLFGSFTLAVTLCGAVASVILYGERYDESMPSNVFIMLCYNRALIYLHFPHQIKSHPLLHLQKIPQCQVIPYLPI